MEVAYKLQEGEIMEMIEKLAQYGMFDSEKLEEGILTSDHAQLAYLKVSNQRDFISVDSSIFSDSIIQAFLTSSKLHKVVEVSDENIFIKRFSIREIEKLENENSKSFSEKENRFSEKENTFSEKENTFSEKENTFSLETNTQERKRERKTERKTERERERKGDQNPSHNFSKVDKTEGEKKYLPAEFKLWINENQKYLQDAHKIIETHLAQKIGIELFTKKVSATLTRKK